jgi:hypothetical protein
MPGLETIRQSEFQSLKGPCTVRVRDDTKGSLRDNVNESNRGVECPEHGVRDATYVCRHLASGTGAGFHCGHDDDDPDRLWPDAWCDACESVRQSEDGWEMTAVTVHLLGAVGAYRSPDDRGFSFLAMTSVHWAQ